MADAEDAPVGRDADVGVLLTRWRAGDSSARDRLTPTVYAELKSLARGYMRREAPGHTLQPTALVNEACLRLLGSDPDTADRGHFVALAARTMRQVLVDHARRKQAAKRIAPEDRVELDTGVMPAAAPTIDVLALDDALTRLARIAPRAARLVEVRYFGGLDAVEAARVLGISRSTADRDWRAARAWLRRALAG